MNCHIYACELFFLLEIDVEDFLAKAKVNPMTYLDDHL